MRKLITLALGLFLLAAACASPAQRSTEPAPTILISIDGFRADYLDRGITPTLSRLAAEGVRASMRPSFPSKTFPNHYTIVTGLRPDHHGVINNRMEDPERPGVTFALWDRAVSSDPIWWRDGVPIWVTAERAGIRTGTMFWPGSDFELHGVRPSQWRPFDQSMPSDTRVDTLLSWFDLPTAERPRFFTLYFDIVDTAGHEYGPTSPELNQAVVDADAAIGRLVAGLAQRGLGGRVNVVIVADHGMTEVSRDRVMDLDAMAPASIAHVVWDGAFAGVRALPGHEAELDASLVGKRQHGECWRRGELPARFQYGTHPRSPNVICLADPGWVYRSATVPPWEPSHGDHGFDNETLEMRALFIASGPAIRRGVTLETFDNVSVYPLLTRLVGLTPERNDGDPAVAAAALR